MTPATSATHSTGEIMRVPLTDGGGRDRQTARAALHYLQPTTETVLCRQRPYWAAERMPVLAEHYGFTEEELYFIINYDIKYRMGREE